MDTATARSVALIVTALNHLGRRDAPAELTAEAGAYIPWILTGTGPPARLVLTIEGDPMPLTIDSVNAKAVLAFEDRDHDPVAPPAGAIATATSSDTNVLTVGPGTAGTDANGVAVIEFALAEVAAGTSELSVHATAADGSALLGPDGVTPIPDAAPVSVTVNPGAPAGEVFTVPGA